jgi:hypothetical protein
MIESQYPEQPIIGATFFDLFRDFRNFLDYPRRDIAQERLSLNRFGQIVGLHYAILISVMIVMGIFSTAIGIDKLDHSIDDLMSNSSMWYFMFLLVLVAPVLEEIFFRFPLKYRRGTIFILTCIITLLTYYISASYLPDMNELIPSENLTELEASGTQLNLPALMLACCTFLLGSLCIFILSLSKEWLHDSSEFISRLFPYVFFLTAVFFGFVHFTNFSGEINWFWIPVLVLPQLVMGLLLGYIRLRYGMWSNILLHAVNNLLPAVIMLSASHVGTG